MLSMHNALALDTSLLVGNGWIWNLFCLLAAYDVAFHTPFEVETRLRTAAGVAFLSHFQVVWIINWFSLARVRQTVSCPTVDTRLRAVTRQEVCVGATPSGGGTDQNELPRHLTRVSSLYSHPWGRSAFVLGALSDAVLEPVAQDGRF